MPRVCPNCKSTDFDTDPARGDTVCTGCGSVLEENNIISEVTFAENSDGSTSVIGQFVSSEALAGPHISGLNHGSSRDSRAVTLDRGRREINDIGAKLKLGKHFCDCTYNCFKLAQKYGFLRGRKLEHVVVACWYLTCRLQTLPYLLLDFSDVSQVNVFILGKIFIALTAALFIKVPILDPCMYINRFAQKMDFKEKTNEVILAATRLVSRMKRDWIHTGRRPSGLCGAALLVAARMYGFSCSVRDVVRVVKIGKETIRKRLMEFDETPSSQLTINEFLNIDLESAEDPPSFTIARHIKPQENMKEIENEINQLTSVIDNELEKEIIASNRKGQKRKTMSDKSEEIPLNIVNESLSLEGVFSSENDENVTAQFMHSTNPENIDINIDEPPSIIDGLVLPSSKSLGLTMTEEESMSIPPTNVDKNDISERVDENDHFSDSEISEDEINKLLLNPEEVVIKTKIWNEEYGDLYEEILAKQKLKEIEEAKKEKQNPKKKKKKLSQKEYYKGSRTAGEAINKLLKRKKLSNKINYDALKGLIGEDNSTKLDQDHSNKINISPAAGTLANIAKYDKKFGPSTVTRLPKIGDPIVLNNNDDFKKPNVKHVTSRSLLGALSENQPTNEPVIIESGPLPSLADHDDTADELEEDDEPENISAAQLMSNAGLGGNYGQSEDYGYDDYD